MCETYNLTFESGITKQWNEKLIRIVLQWCIMFRMLSFVFIACQSNIGYICGFYVLLCGYKNMFWFDEKLIRIVLQWCIMFRMLFSRTAYLILINEPKIKILTWKFQNMTIWVPSDHLEDLQSTLTWFNLTSFGHHLTWPWSPN